MDGNQAHLRWDRIAKARARLEAGFYDDPQILDAILDRCLDDIIVDVVNCPVGDGHRYRDIAAEAISVSLGQVVDPFLMRKEFSSQGGRGDIELPVRTESLSEYPLWDSWSRRFGIRSIVVEIKNTRSHASVRDIQQTLAYLVTSRLGRFGMTVSRSGFSRGARKQLRAIAASDDYLVLPFDQDDLEALLRVSGRGADATMEFLRRKETLLLQAA